MLSSSAIAHIPALPDAMRFKFTAFALLWDQLDRVNDEPEKYRFYTCVAALESKQIRYTFNLNLR